MINYDVSNDLKAIRTLLHITQQDLSDATGISQVSIARYETGKVKPTPMLMDRLYGYAFQRGVDLNSLKAHLFQDDSKELKVLFHGARGLIDSPIDIHHSVLPNDFGKGFYAGEKLEQAVAWVAEEPLSSVYCFYFNQKDLKHLLFTVGEEWMLAVLYYRDRLGKFSDHPIIKKIVEEVESSDYLIAPIADNQMYQTLEDFGLGLITDVQCFHALSATNLGMQYVFKTAKACQNAKPISRLFLSSIEKQDCLNKKRQMDLEGKQKVELAYSLYRRQGKYIDEYFK